MGRGECQPRLLPATWSVQSGYSQVTVGMCVGREIAPRQDLSLARTEIATARRTRSLFKRRREAALALAGRAEARAKGAHSFRRLREYVSKFETYFEISSLVGWPDVAEMCDERE